MSDLSKRIADLTPERRELLRQLMEGQKDASAPKTPALHSAEEHDQDPITPEEAADRDRMQRAGIPATLASQAADENTGATKRMDFSLFYFANADGGEPANKYRLLLEGARFADTHHFAAVWTPERHFHAFGGLYPNPALTSAALATVTERIQIRAGSVVLPLHDPLLIAEEWAVVDNLSHGRVSISVASGWSPNDFVIAPQNYANRKDLMARGIATIRRLWKGEKVWRHDGNGTEIEVGIRPRPIQRELPIWVTAAGSPDTFRLAGEIGANLLTHLLGQSIEELAENIGVYRRAWSEHGYDPGAGHVTLMLHTFVGSSVEAVRQQVREPFSNYLRTSVGLWMTRRPGQKIEDFTEAELTEVVSHAFDRFFESSGLFGTPSTCLPMIERVQAIGVDEVACLIDFGVEVDAVLSSLPGLDTLRQLSNTYKGGV